MSNAVRLRPSCVWRVLMRRAVASGTLCLTMTWMCGAQDVASHSASRGRALDARRRSVASPIGVSPLMRSSTAVSRDGTRVTFVSAHPVRATLPVVTRSEFFVWYDDALTDRWRGTAGSDSLGVGFGLQQFAPIAAGTFRMGSLADDGYRDEKPAHTVTITQRYLLQRTEVTQGQWQSVMTTNPSVFNQCGATCPVEQVSWYDVQQFLQQLNAQDPGKGYRLPTEAEWEYAARAGGAGEPADSGTLDAMAWYEVNAGTRTHSVGLKRPNALGLYDLYGNVFEWVQDSYAAYVAGASSDPRGPTAGQYRVTRGGSWFGDATVLRAGYRGFWDPLNSQSMGTLGFRLVRNR